MSSFVSLLLAAAVLGGGEGAFVPKDGWRLTRFAKIEGTRLVVDVPKEFAKEGGTARCRSASRGRRILRPAPTTSPSSASRPSTARSSAASSAAGTRGRRQSASRSTSCRFRTRRDGTTGGRSDGPTAFSFVLRTTRGATSSRRTTRFRSPISIWRDGSPPVSRLRR